MRSGLYRCAMRLATFRRLTWVLVLVLLAGPAMPAFASMPDVGHQGVLAPGVHVHADSTAHVHVKLSAPDGAPISDCGGVRPGKAPQHCPGCVTVAGCAVACLGIGLLPVPLVLPAPARSAWTAAAVASPAGAVPTGDLGPDPSSSARPALRRAATPSVCPQARREQALPNEQFPPAPRRGPTTRTTMPPITRCAALLASDLTLHVRAPKAGT